YSEALERERGPRQLELRVLLGQTQLKLGEVDEALRQARLVLDVEKNRPDAMLLQARALADAGATMGEKATRRLEAIARLREAIQREPAFAEAYHTLAGIHLKSQDRNAAVAVLKEALRVNPEDATAGGQLVQLLSDRLPSGQPPAATDLAEA